MKTWKEICKEAEEYKNWYEANLETLATSVELEDEYDDRRKNIGINFVSFVKNKYPELYEILEFEGIEYYWLDYIYDSIEIPYNEYEFFEELVSYYEDSYNIVESLCSNFNKGKYIQEYLKSK